MKLCKRAVMLRDAVIENAKTQSAAQVAKALGLKVEEVRFILMSERGR